MSSRKDGSTVKQLIAVLVLGAFLVTVSIGCGGSTPTTKPPASTDKKDDKTPKP